MTPLDLVLIVAGIGCAVGAFWPEKKKPTSEADELDEMAAELYKLIEKDSWSWEEVEADSIRFDLLFAKFQGLLKTTGQDCPDPDWPHRYNLKKWLLKYIGRGY